MEMKEWLTNKKPRHLKRIKRGIRKTVASRHDDWNVFLVSEIRRHYAEGKTIAQLSYHYGYSRPSIQRLLGEFFKGVK